MSSTILPYLILLSGYATYYLFLRMLLHQGGLIMQDKYSPQKKYAKNNIKKLSCSYQAKFVEEFKTACALGITQSEVIRKAMIETIEKAKMDKK